MTVRKRANNTPVTPPPTNTKTKIEDDKQKNGNATQITNKENEDDNSNKTQFPAAMTERQQNGSPHQQHQQKQPNDADSGNSDDTKRNDRNDPLLSIRLDVYHNLRSLKESLNAFSTQDFSKIPLHLWSVLKDRTKHVDKSMTGISLYAFTIIFALALITRFYAISWPHHVW